MQKPSFFTTILKAKPLRAFSLPTALVVCILICLLVLFAIALFDINTLFYFNYHTTRQKKEDFNSAFVLYCNDSTLIENFQEGKATCQLYKDIPSSHIQYQVKNWGLYECVTASILDDNFHSTRLVGKAQDCHYEAALWVCSRDRVLSFAGSTRIRGKTFVPINGISYVQLGNDAFQGEEIDDYYIDLSEKELPPIDSSYMEVFERLSQWEKILPLPSESEITPYHSFRDETVHYALPEGTTQLHARGNVVLHAQTITLSSDFALSDVILIANKVVIEEGFKGSLQIMASDTVIIKDQVELQYPSGIYLKGNEGKTYLSIGKHSKLNGYAVLWGDTEKSSGFYIANNFHQESSSLFYGLLYVDGIADIRGTLSGAAYVKECYYLPENGIYAGTIYDAQIDRNQKVAYPFALSESMYRRKEMKTLQ